MQLRFEADVLEPVDVRPGKFFGQGNFSYRVNAEGAPRDLLAFRSSLFRKTALRR